MTARKKRRSHPLTGRTATVNLSRAGLTVEVKDVPAQEIALVAGSLLMTYRKMAKRGFDELIEHTFSAHASPIDTPEEPDDIEFELPPTSRRRRQIGFRAG